MGEDERSQHRVHKLLRRSGHVPCPGVARGRACTGQRPQREGDARTAIASRTLLASGVTCLAWPDRGVAGANPAAAARSMLDLGPPAVSGTRRWAAFTAQRRRTCGRRDVLHAAIRVGRAVDCRHRGGSPTAVFSPTTGLPLDTRWRGPQGLGQALQHPTLPHLREGGEKSSTPAPTEPGARIGANTAASGTAARLDPAVELRWPASP